ncbi:hypothetical protein [Vibrio vulnificus]|uniref:hypothetical protein n=1 Tax=Vibrio vulnificus TaxID=672 RepID=UPI0032422CB2
MFYSFGHPKSLLNPYLPASSMKRIFSFLSENGVQVDRAEDITFQHLKGFDVETITSLIKGKGVQKDIVCDFEGAFEDFLLWDNQPGQRIEFDKQKMSNLKNVMTLQDYRQKEEEDKETEGTYVLLMNKHKSAIAHILKSSDHPLSNEILELWKEDIHSSGSTLIGKAPFIEWEESEGGYSISTPNSRHSPYVDVYHRWDSVVLNQKVSIIQVEHDKSCLECEFHIYLNLDESPELLLVGDYDFSLMNSLIIKKLQSRMPVEERFAVHPDNTKLFSTKSLEAIENMSTL